MLDNLISAIPMTKIALGIEYGGSHYCGWQRQQQVQSIQGCLEIALTKVANESIQIYCAGRTDTGVHAIGQVIHFETSVIRKDSAWTMGVNSYLPNDIVVRWSKVVSSDFHARFSATARQYRYIIFNHRYRPVMLRTGVTHYHAPLDAKKMHIAAQSLVGEKDFTSFRAIRCQSKSPWRNIKYVNICRYGDYIVIDIKANAFVHHMVRNIVGSLLAIGCGDKNIHWITELLILKDRTKAATIAKAEGLYLIAVDYPLKYKLPKTIIGPIF
ncbi:MAG: tRNA pseudouridine(38-40) synthase TruA [Arsenophonus sp. ET-LJ4-MAG3]